MAKTPPTAPEVAKVREEIWTAIVHDRVTSDTALAMRDLLPGKLEFDKSTALGLQFDIETEWDFVNAVIRVAQDRMPAEKVVLALLLEENKIDEAAERYEASIRTAGDDVVAKLRIKAGLFSLVRPRIAINAYARILQIVKVDVTACLRIACLAKLTGDPASAAKMFLELLELPGLADKDRARTLSELARIAQQLDHPDAAAEWAEQALALHTKLDDGLNMAEESRALAVLAAARRDCAAAQRFAEQYVAIGQQFEDLRSMLDGLTFLVQITLECDQVPRAEHHAKRAHMIAQQLDDAHALGDAWVASKDIALSKQDLAGALDACSRAVNYYEQANCEPHLAKELRRLGLIYFENGRADAAAEAYERARRIFARIGDKEGNAGTLHSLAILDLDEYDFESAEPRLLIALAIYTDMNAQQKCADVLVLLGNVAAARGQIEQARESWMKALARYNNSGHGDGANAQYLRKRLDETS